MRKERIIMLASSVFVLTALTMTGFYVKEKNDAEQDGYVVDMSTLEKKTGNKTKELAESVKKDSAGGGMEESLVQGDDLDYDPNFQEASSDDVENTWGASANKEAARENIKEKTEEEKEEKEEKIPEEIPEESSMVAVEASSEAAWALSFQEKENLAWPVAGDVLINYSMDKTVYFPTLQQYKYSPAIVIAASEGENITAAADGKVLSVSEDPQLGQTVKMDIGNGYELTYGQLKDIMVLQGDVVRCGDIIGKVAAPTKYYSVEGANVYFKLEKDKNPVNPFQWLE